MCHHARLHWDATTRVAFVALLLCSAAAVAQQFEFAIPIPESLGTPGQVMYASGEGKLYCYLPASGRLAVINPETRELAGFVAIGRGMDTLSYSRRWQRLYCSGDSGLAFVRTTDDEVVLLRSDWGRSKLILDPTQCRAFVYSSQNMLRSVDAATGEVLDSLTGIAYGDRTCFDPLHLRLWCRMSGLIDCADTLYYVGALSGMYFPTVDPWDDLVYGVNYYGILRYDPVTRAGGLWWATESSEVWQLAVNAPRRRLYFFHQMRYGSMVYYLKTIELTTRQVTTGPLVYLPGDVYFAPVGKRVWAAEPNLRRTYAASEVLDAWPICDSIGAVRSVPAYDVATQRTFISDSTTARIVVFRDTLHDLSDAASAFVAGPTDMLDSGAAWVFRSTCVNMGICDKTVPLRLRVYARTADGHKGVCAFSDTTEAWIDGYSYGVAVFDTWHAGVGGEYVAEVTTELPGDVNPSNDTARCTVRVLGPYRDVRPLRILTPPSTVDSGATIVPTAWILNSGGISVEFPVLLAIGSSYADTQRVVLGGGDSTLVSFAQWTASDVGLLIMRCSTMLANDSLAWNNRIGRTVRVLPPGGIATSESLPSVYSVGDWAPNPVSSVARLRYGLPQASLVSAIVYSVDGRQVRSIISEIRPAGYHSITWDGCDGVERHCGPGIYFCHVRAGPLRKSTKLTLTH